MVAPVFSDKENKMVYITGDTHADFRRFSMANFPQQAEMTKDDFVIICGDFGGVWEFEGESKREEYWLRWLDEKTFTTLFVDGNHENFNRLYQYPEIEFHGGRVHRIRNSILHLMRGYKFDLCGSSFFAFGGASSHDISDGILDPANYTDGYKLNQAINQMETEGKSMFRIKNISWWERELPNVEEICRGLNTLKYCNYEVNYVISHCLPQSVATIFSMGLYREDCLTKYFDELLKNGLKFSRWYSGHYHVNERIMDKYNILYQNIIRLV